MTEKRKYDSTVARMAGNIAAGWGEAVTSETEDDYISEVARISVALAREILAEVQRTEPSTEIVFPTCPKCGVVLPCHAHPKP